MHWVNFLHIYQPSDQTKEIVERVVNESYRPLFKGFLSIPNLKINININGALTEILAQRKYSDVLLNIRKLAQDNRLEFTESAKYHSLLPFLEEKEALRQIEKNHQTNKKYFGKVYRPYCFFPPEMAYSPKIIKTIKKTGCDSILLDEIAYNGGRSLPPSDELLGIKNGPLVFFRERRVSNSIMSAMIRSQKEFSAVLGDDIKENKYLCTAMDGETFGHHRPGLEKSLFKIIANKNPEQVFFSQLPSLFPLGEKINPVSSTWASTVEDIKLGVQFYSWKNPENKVHTLQWKFLKYLIFSAKKKKLTPSLEEVFDQALASDQFFWASGEPWWSIEMIEKGAWSTLQALRALPLISKSEIKKGEDYYKEILAASFWWQRSGKIEQMAKKYKESTRIPFKERTLENNKPEVYSAFIDKMKSQMKKESKKENFERAILWRDAVWKMETKNDIYDAIHAVDLLRTEVSDIELRQLMDNYKKKYENLRPGQPEKRKA
jgi:hypothetical protein